jgi:hypothetical protein
MALGNMQSQRAAQVILALEEKRLDDAKELWLSNILQRPDVAEEAKKFISDDSRTPENWLELLEKPKAEEAKVTDDSKTDVGGTREKKANAAKPKPVPKSPEENSALSKAKSLGVKAGQHSDVSVLAKMLKYKSVSDYLDYANQLVLAAMNDEDKADAQVLMRMARKNLK